LKVLALLMERSGELVSREDLRKRLWHDDTYVDFEHSLNAAVKRLRRALEDDAERPQFVETVPRYGYRFIGFIETTPAGSIAVSPPSLPAAQEAHLPGTSSHAQRKLFGWLTIFLSLAGIVAVAGFHFLRSAPPAISSLVVLPFVNANNDSNLNYLTDGISCGIIEEVSHVRSLSVVAWSMASRYRSGDPAATGRA
jgi:DNA-binding winged helix-turn-helix (wHTH) protein